MTSTTAVRQWVVASMTWTLLSIAGFCVGLLVSLPVNAALNLVVDMPHLAEMALWPVTWGSVSMAGILAAGRLAFRRPLAVSRAGLLFGATGILLAAGLQVALQQWAVARFAYADPEFIGPSAALFAVLVGLGAATFGVFVAPRGMAAWPLGFVLFGTGCVAFVLLSNLPGLGDGLAPESRPLAAWLGASGLYAVLAAIASLIRARHPGATHDGGRAIP
jgi:hypothetical protein